MQSPFLLVYTTCAGASGHPPLPCPPSLLRHITVPSRGPAHCGAGQEDVRWAGGAAARAPVEAERRCASEVALGACQAKQLGRRSGHRRRQPPLHPHSLLLHITNAGRRAAGDSAGHKLVLRAGGAVAGAPAINTSNRGRCEGLSESCEQLQAPACKTSCTMDDPVQHHRQALQPALTFLPHHKRQQTRGR